MEMYVKSNHYKKKYFRETLNLKKKLKNNSKISSFIQHCYFLKSV